MEVADARFAQPRKEGNRELAVAQEFGASNRVLCAESGEHAISKLRFRLPFLFQNHGVGQKFERGRELSAKSRWSHSRVGSADESLRGYSPVSHRDQLRFEQRYARIRPFIPHYEEMLDVAAAAMPPRARTIIDLGIGTGALSARCLIAKQETYWEWEEALAALAKPG